jgi:hypothetical protein
MTRLLLLDSPEGDSPRRSVEHLSGAPAASIPNHEKIKRN